VDAVRIPRPLPENGTIRVVSVAGPVSQEPFERGIELIQQRGVRVVFNESILATGHPFLAADDPERLQDLADAFADPDADAILCARGGYGSMRLLPRFDVTAAAAAGKPFAGFSDNTALHLALNHSGLVTFHAPVVTALGQSSQGAAQADRLIAALQSTLSQHESIHGTAAASGRVTGRLIGGNLSLLAACVPLPTIELPAGCILLIEETGEPLYRIDRMLTTLQLGGWLDKVAGVALGSFTRCGQEQPRGGLTATETAVERLRDLGVPIVADLPIGHGDSDLTIPLGAEVVIDGSVGSLVIDWGS
jgi:muramoyltetrapeptide carboxypeptidase